MLLGHKCDKAEAYVTRLDPYILGMIRTKDGTVMATSLKFSWIVPESATIYIVKRRVEKQLGKILNS